MNYKKGTQTRGCMKSVMRYVSQLSKTLWDGQQLVSGIGCQPETAFDEFLSTKLLHHKDGGVMFYHMVQSFPKGANIDPRAAHEAACRLAGYFEGWVDRVIMCVMDIFFAFPSILLAIFISAVLGRGLVNTMIAIGIVNIPVFARTVRASVISAKGLEYVQNAKSVGVRTGTILIRHISPNVVAPFTVQATLALSSAILTEASMSFLGLGIQPPDPSWGSMLSEARTYMEQAPWMAVFPALFIIVTILLFNILGDSLRDVLDPKLKL